MNDLIDKLNSMQDLLFQQKESNSAETLVTCQSDNRAMTLALAKQSQVEAQLRSVIDKLRLQLAELTEARRDHEMALHYSRVIRCKEEQLALKDQELKTALVSLSSLLMNALEKGSNHAASAR